MAKVTTPLRGQILRVTPGATYEGRVYDQHVAVRLENGPIVSLFDRRLVASEAMLGKRARVEVEDFLAQMMIEPEPAYGVDVPAPSADLAPDIVSWRGRVVQLERWSVREQAEAKLLDAKFVLDVGAGGLLVVPAVDQNERMIALTRSGLHEGDFVRVWGGRLDLLSLTLDG